MKRQKKNVALMQQRGTKEYLDKTLDSTSLHQGYE